VTYLIEKVYKKKNNTCKIIISKTSGEIAISINKSRHIASGTSIILQIINNLSTSQLSRILTIAPLNQTAKLY
ncbi:MAG TPA: hypothetical protein PKW71_03325, partial [Anaerohalosphaeraceae bacterium]|nr:hypothetical protein [Anaerohalosphaeraceae bacterium]